MLKIQKTEVRTPHGVSYSSGTVVFMSNWYRHYV